MTDFRHDILGPNGLSTESETFTMKASSIETLNDLEIIENEVKGKNILHNGEPTVGVQSWGDTVENMTYGWTKVLSPSKGSNARFSSSTKCLDVIFTALTSSSKPGLVQFEKVYKKDGAVFNDGNLGGELKDLIGGLNATLSMEVKSSLPVYVHKQLMVQFNDGTPNLTIFDPATSEKDPPIVLPDDGWKKLTVTDKIPENWKTVIEGDNVKTVMLMINIYLVDNVTSSIHNVEYQLKNVQLEYGAESSDFMLSDWDKELHIEQGIIPEGTIVFTENHEDEAVDVSQYALADVFIEPATYYTVTVDIIDATAARNHTFYINGFDGLTDEPVNYITTKAGQSMYWVECIVYREHDQEKGKAFVLPRSINYRLEVTGDFEKFGDGYIIKGDTTIKVLS